VFGIARFFSLLQEEPVNDGGDETKKQRKKNSGKWDMKRKGTGPRTRRKKAKKGK